MSLNTALRIAQSGITFNQSALGTISHNVSNVNTTGFSRQEVQGVAVSFEGKSAGVTSAGVIRKVNQSLLNRLGQQSAVVGYSTARGEYMKNLEVSFGKPGSNVSAEKLVNNFFNQMQNVINNPEFASLRQNFNLNGSLLTDTINTLQQELVDTQINIETQIDIELTKVNEALRNINNLNGQIRELANTPGSRSAADLMDERQQQINIVSERFKISVNAGEFGEVSLITEDGRALVDSSYAVLERTPPAPGETFQGIGYRKVLSNGAPSPNLISVNTDRLTAGSIKGLINVRDEVAPDFISQLDNFAATLIREVNYAHSQGSATPPPNSITTYAESIASPATTTLSSAWGLVPGSQFDLSVVNRTNGAPLATTVGAATLGPDTAINGDFSAGASWTANAPWNIAGGVATIDGSQAANVTLEQAAGLTPGALYTVSVTVSNYTAGSMTVQAGDTAQPFVPAITGNGTYTMTLRAGGNGNLIFNADAAFAADLDNVTIQAGASNSPITYEAGETLQDLVDKINNNQALNQDITASINGGRLQVTANNPANGVVFGQGTNNILGLMSTNPYFTGTDASTIAVRADILSDSNNLAVAQMRSSDGGLTFSDNRNAIAIANVATQRFSFAAAGSLANQETNMAGYMIAVNTNLGSQLADNSARVEFDQVLQQDLFNRNQSVSGVNLDEELSNLLIYQRAFQASARVVGIVDDLFDSLLNIL